jgi:hypothetical protein
MKVFKALHDKKKNSFFVIYGQMSRRVNCSLTVVDREVFSIEKKRGRLGEVSNVVGVKLFEKAGSPLARLKDITLVDAKRGALNSLLGSSPCKIPFGALHFIVLGSL